MRVTAGSSGYSDAVDLYNGASGTWSTAQLSVWRYLLSATSVGNVAIFAGGSTGIYSLTLFVGVCDAGGCRLMGVTAGSSSNAVDLYNGASGTWSTAQLSVARYSFAATSVGNVAIFAGGKAGDCSLTLFVEGLLFGLMRVGDGVTFACLRRAACCFVACAVQEVAV
jgi:hypothetical protein